MAFTAIIVLAAAAAQGGTEVTAAEVDRRARIGVEARLLYDDNILRLDDGEAVLAGRSRHDARLTTSLVVDLATRVGLQRPYLRGSAGYDFHARNGFLDRERISLEGGVNWMATTRCDGNASLGYSRQQSLLEDIEIVLPNARETETLAVRGGCRIGVGFRPELSYRHRSLTNSNVLLQDRNRRTSLLAASLAYSRSDLAAVSLSASEEVLRAPDRAQVSPFFADRYRLREARGTVSRAVSDLRLSGSVGYAGIDSSATGGSEEEILTWAASLGWTPAQRFRARLSTARLIDASADVPAGYFILRNFTADLGYRLGRATDFSFGLIHADRRLRDTRPGQKTFDRTTLLRIGVAARPWRAIRLQAELQREMRDTDVVQGDFDSNRAILTVAAEF